MKRELRGVEWFVETEAFGWVPTFNRDKPNPRWQFWCQGVGKDGNVPELIARDVDCTNLHVLIAAIRVTARELNDWRSVDVFCTLQECFWSNTGQQLSFKFADAKTYRELPMMADILDVTDEEMAELTKEVY